MCIFHAARVAGVLLVLLHAPIASANCVGPDCIWPSAAARGLEVRTFQQADMVNPGEMIKRRYLQYVPSKLISRRKAYPLVIVLPGADMSAEMLRAWDTGDRLELLAEKEKFILVYANAVAPSALEEENPRDPFYANGGYWRTCHGRPGAGPEFFNVDDIAYLREIIKRVRSEKLPVDPARIYLMGMSNGGEMAQRAAREMTELAGFAAVMPVTNEPATIALGQCPQSPQPQLAAMFIYSPGDTLLAPIYAENQADYASMMQSSLANWRGALGIREHRVKRRVLPDVVEEGASYFGSVPHARDSRRSRVTRYDYAPSAAGFGFAVLEIGPVAGHAWPNLEPTPFHHAEAKRNGFRNNDFAAEEVAWDFLKHFRRHQTRRGE